MTLVANARIYAVNPAVAARWAELFAFVSRASGVPLTVIDHAAPAPLEALWRRPDLGLAFICGFPFARGDIGLRPVAAPVPASALTGGRPLYATHFVVRADSAIARLEQSFGGRIGWTVAHSQSGFQAVRSHLLPFRDQHGSRLYDGSVGPLVTPRAVVVALAEGRIDIGPLDSYWRDLLALHEPETAAGLRIVATTRPTPPPLLAAAAAVDEATIAILRNTILGLGLSAEARPMLAALGLAGFAPVAAADYAGLLKAAAEVDAAGYPQPG